MSILQMVVYLLVAVPLLAFFLTLYARSKSTSKTRFTTAAECRCILDGSQAPDARKNHLTKWEAKAIPNRTTRRAFGIENAFTTDNKRVAEISVNRVQRRMNDVDGNWSGLSRILSDAGWDIVGYYETVDALNVPLTWVVQALVLRASLWVFFNMREEVNIDYLLGLVYEMEDTLRRIKYEEGVSDFKEGLGLEFCLSLVFARYNVDTLDPRANPFNSLLHCFETIAPVVSRAFIELRRREEYKPILAAFVRKPTSTQFSLELGEDEISAEFLIKEALRLYPPTRQVERAFQFDPKSPEKVTLTADIEACHLDPKIWGADVLEFKPDRWKKVTVVQDLAFLAFGSRPFLCPASHGFGLRIVGLLVGVLLDMFNDDWMMNPELDEKLDESGSASTQRLSNEPGACDDVSLEASESAMAWVDVS
ncbi:hypothetical protein BDV18DRAFT_157449 [Aspergillus unguis]